MKSSTDPPPPTKASTWTAPGPPARDPLPSLTAREPNDHSTEAMLTEALEIAAEMAAVLEASPLPTRGEESDPGNEKQQQTRQ